MIHDDTVKKLDSKAYSPDDDRIDLALGMKIKTLRKIANKTQSEIAYFLDISPQQYQKYEKGSSKCSIQNLYRLATYYRINVSELLPYATPVRSADPHSASSAAPNDLPPPVVAPSSGEGPILDEAKALSEMLNILLRMPAKTMRKKVLTTLLNLE